MTTGLDRFDRGTENPELFKSEGVANFHIQHVSTLARYTHVRALPEFKSSKTTKLHHKVVPVGFPSIIVDGDKASMQITDKIIDLNCVVNWQCGWWEQCLRVGHYKVFPVTPVSFLWTPNFDSDSDSGSIHLQLSQYVLHSQRMRMSIRRHALFPRPAAMEVLELKASVDSEKPLANTGLRGHLPSGQSNW